MARRTVTTTTINGGRTTTIEGDKSSLRQKRPVAKSATSRAAAADKLYGATSATRLSKQAKQTKRRQVRPAATQAVSKK